jgi:3-phosphoshikimate 1-carboxyvinyltransferase
MTDGGVDWEELERHLREEVVHHLEARDATPTKLTVRPVGPLRGALLAPPDKSISHRAVLLAAMGSGVTRISNCLFADDTAATIQAVHWLGARIDSSVGARGDRILSIGGVGLRGARAPAFIDVANAGTLIRLLPGWLAGCSGSWTLDGDESIRHRPVDRVAEPLRAMGAKVECRDGRLPPLRIEGAELSGIEYELPVASAQVKSCVLLAGLNADGETTVVEPIRTRDHTERMLRAAGAEIDVAEVGGSNRITLRRAARLHPGRIDVPGDVSSAAFFLVAASIVPGSEVGVNGVGLNPTRAGLLEILGRMGAAIELGDGWERGGEPVGELVVRHAQLRATEVGAGDVARAIDELPLVALAGCFAEGETVVRGAAELRHKESDRIASVVEGLRGIGADIEALDDGFAVRGTGGLQGGRLDARGDHRMAMLGAIAGLGSRDGVTVDGFDAAAVSYPGFEADMRSLLAR